MSYFQNKQRTPKQPKVLSETDYLIALINPYLLTVDEFYSLKSLSRQELLKTIRLKTPKT